MIRVAVLNAGSSTVKAALVDVAPDSSRVRWRGSRPLAGSGGAESAFSSLLAELGDQGERVDATGHRVVHGGTRFTEPVCIDASVEEAVASFTPLAPLHNPLALEGMRVARAMFPDKPRVAVFDTAFHAKRVPESLRFALPWALSEELGLFRYGFHGIAHASLVESLAREQHTSGRETHAVTLQLGAGCSACAVANGRSIETSMGFSPLGGLLMATRPGDLDPGVLLELLRRGHTASDVERIVTRESGLLGLAGSSDMQSVLAAEARGDERAHVAADLFVRQIVLNVGAYFTLLRGRGALAFGGGIGTHSAEIRRRVCEGLTAWEIELDPERNAEAAPGLISAETSRAVYALETDEESLIARSTRDLLDPESSCHGD